MVPGTNILYLAKLLVICLPRVSEPRISSAGVLHRASNYIGQSFHDTDDAWHPFSSPFFCLQYKAGSYSTFIAPPNASLFTGLRLEVQVTMPETTHHGRTLIILLDGTSNQFDATNTNVVKLCQVLRMDDRARQMIYYQPGIGTYTEPGITGTVERVAADAADLAVAWYLSGHVMDAYKFLMENHLPKDRICIFGFSRGAYTARALAGMLHAVGLLPRGNCEQVSFAYDMYRFQNPVASKFKKTFCKDVDIEFLGVWDTVASAGIIVQKTLPFISTDTIKNFRHAISLDENRIRFGLTPWSPTEASGVGTEKYDGGKTVSVKEMWFSGTHCDIGGGEMFDADKDKPCLSNIALRWMLHEVVEADCGILFDNENLDDLGIPDDCVPRVHEDGGKLTQQSSSETMAGTKKRYDAKHRPLSWREADKIDAEARMQDPLSDNLLWWLIQIPTWDGKCLKVSGRRKFPSDVVRRPYENIHWTVLYRTNTVKGYKPRAILPADWKVLASIGTES